MTYPPDEHVLRDLQIESWLDATDRSFAVLPVSDALLGPDGSVRAGALVTLVDLACARVAFPAAHPHWIATADLSLVSGTPVTDSFATINGGVLGFLVAAAAHPMNVRWQVPESGT